MDFRCRKVYYESIRSVVYCLIFTVMLLYIVHKRNILTNGRNERRHLERKHNQLYFLKNVIYFLINVIILSIIFIHTTSFLRVYNFHLLKVNRTEKTDAYLTPQLANLVKPLSLCFFGPCCLSFVYEKLEQLNLVVTEDLFKANNVLEKF